ncbi:MAG: alpha/beta hydrolase [Actinomycetota bacterium]
MTDSTHPRATLERWFLDDVALAVATSGTGPGPAVLFIHGSWDDHHTWDAVRAALPGDRVVVAYDRRGHSASTDLVGQGTIRQDVADAAQIIRRLGDTPVHVVGHSYGACIALLLASDRPDLVGGLVLHEPPLFGLLADSHAEILGEAQASMARAVELGTGGRIEEAAIEFIEQVAFGPGSWTGLFDAPERARMLANVDTWIDQCRDPDRLAVDISALSSFAGPITLTTGTASLPTFIAVTDIVSRRLPAATVVSIDGAGHGAPISHPTRLAEAIDAHLRAAAS